ncbi:hypothetical protein GF327_03550 [Candidatus Woesearchaeota archaeon]|nr:hypothetical protein [Candidatus Woesearchaeota archaeon]
MALADIKNILKKEKKKDPEQPEGKIQSAESNEAKTENKSQQTGEKIPQEIPESTSTDKITNVILEQLQQINNNVNDKIRELDNEFKKISSEINEFKNENKKYQDQISSIEKNVEKFIGLYELVTNEYNPFVKGNSPITDIKETQKTQEQPVQEKQPEKIKIQKEIKITDEPDSLSVEADKIKKQENAPQEIQTQTAYENERIVVEEKISENSSPLEIKKHPEVTKEEFVRPLQEKLQGNTTVSRIVSPVKEEHNHENEPKQADPEHREFIDEISQKVDSDIKQGFNKMEKEVVTDIVTQVLKKVRTNQEETEEKQETQIKKIDKFYLKNGTALKNPEELYHALFIMEDPLFKFHVNQEKNDFANWISLFDENTAQKLMPVRTRSEFIKILKRYCEK